MLCFNIFRDRKLEERSHLPLGIFLLRHSKAQNRLLLGYNKLGHSADWLDMPKPPNAKASIIPLLARKACQAASGGIIKISSIRIKGTPYTLSHDKSKSCLF